VIKTASGCSLTNGWTSKPGPDVLFDVFLTAEQPFIVMKPVNPAAAEVLIKSLLFMI
jgi:hypothetical protein